MLLYSVAAGAFAASLASQFAGSHQLAQRSLYGTDAERRTKFPNILFGKTTYLVLRCKPHYIQCGSFDFHKGETVLIIPVGRKDRSKKVFDKRDRIICSLMPTIL